MNEAALKSRLKAIAIEKELPFNNIWKQFLLERFLVRLAVSDHQGTFIFKGGLLLANYLAIGRETTDIDFLLANLNAQEQNVELSIRNILSNRIDDNVHFEWDKIETLTQPHMEYSGFRVFLRSNFGNMKDKIQIDIGIGDQVTPIQRIFFPFEYKGKPIFSGEISLMVYPPENIFAEKLESIVSRGALNSRMKDYHDVLLMTRENDLLDFAKLNSAIHNTFSHRATDLGFPVFIDESGMQGLQRLWSKHLQGLGDYKNKLNLPGHISELVNEVAQWLLFHKIL